MNRLLIIKEPFFNIPQFDRGIYIYKSIYGIDRDLYFLLGKNLIFPMLKDFDDDIFDILTNKLG